MSTPIVSLMFHRVNDPATQCCPERFTQYLHYLVNHFPIVMPGDPLPDAPLAVMLTFDDAYFDFYHTVFPLLKHHNIKALLAVTTQYIVDKTSLSAQTRLSVPYPEGMQFPLCEEKVPFCTWEELHEMAKTPHVVIASHSHSHPSMASKTTNFDQESFAPKVLLQQKLNQPIDYFVYPYGKMTRECHRRIVKHYDYGVRIGSALNRGWDQKRRYIYRVDADPLWKQNKPLDKKLIQKLTLKYWMNRLRGK